ncbi:Hypothetical protein mma_2766 [Janthinobacterium sp. Marseille]|nr:Hypothetical protein mma_2766 [Janthinobacterium sp. Marseille]
MSATPTLTSSRSLWVRWSDEPRIAHQCVGQSCRTRGQNQDRRHPPRRGPGVGVFRLCRHAGRRACIAQRGQRDPDGGGSLPRDLRRCHARRQLLLDGACPQQHQQRHAAHCHRAIQYRPEDRSVRRYQLRHHVCIVRRLLRNQPHGVPLMAYTQAHLDALEAALVKGEKRVTFGDKTVEYRSVDELQAAIAAVKRDLFEQAVDTGLWPGAPRQIRVTTGKGF